MKLLTDLALIRLYETMHATRVRTADADAMEVMAGELMYSRALFGTLTVVTNHCLQHALALRCEFGMGAGESPVPRWVVRVGGRSGDATDGCTPRFDETAARPGQSLARCWWSWRSGWAWCRIRYQERRSIDERQAAQTNWPTTKSECER